MLHQDIKTDNLFVKLDGSIKLGDFGLGKVLTHLKEDEVKGYVGTPSYSSPEASTKQV